MEKTITITSGNPIVDQVATMNLTGNIIPESWYHTIINENGKTNTLAILILADIVYWYRPTEERDETTLSVSYSKKFHDEDYLQRSYEQLMEKFPRAKKVIITLRGSINANHNTWGGVLFDGEKLYQSKRYDITHIVDRVGGGDSFMGGLIYGLLTYKGDDQKALDFAVAASCLKHTIYGDYNMVTVAEVENLMKGDGSGRVSR